MKKAAMLAAALFVLTSFMAHAQPPSLINYQGFLTDAEGKGLEGVKTLSFSLYHAKTGGSTVWGPQSFPNVPLVEGRFNVILGDDGIADALAKGECYLGIRVDGGAEITPRQKILSAPYALVANTVQGPNLHVNPNNGRVGIGTTNPTAKLDVAGNIVAHGKLNVFKPIVNKDLSVAESHIYVRGSDNGYGLAMGALGSPASGFLQTMLNDEPAPTGVSIPLFLNPDGGNVGIGTTNPTAKLDVAGNIIAESPIQDNHVVTKGYLKGWGADEKRVSYGDGAHSWTNKSAQCPEGYYVVGINVRYRGTCNGACSVDGGTIGNIELICRPLNDN